MTTPSARDREMAQECIRIDHDETVGRIAAALAQARAEEREALDKRSSEEVVRDQRELFQRMIDRAVAEEREACAKVADERADVVRGTIGAGFGIVLSALEELAAAIRARSET